MHGEVFFQKKKKFEKEPLLVFVYRILKWSMLVASFEKNLEIF